MGANFETLPGTLPIDAGTDLTGMRATEDIDGNPRPLNNDFDVGAYEVENSVSNSKLNNYSRLIFYVTELSQPVQYNKNFIQPASSIQS